MKYTVDLHTHSIVSGHAYSTLNENIRYAKEHGVKILGTSEHASSMPGAPHRWYFCNMKVLPRVIDDVTVLRGCEANIMKSDGTIDVDKDEQLYLDYLIASLHDPCFSKASKEETTNAVINAMKENPLVTIIGHIGNPYYDIDFEAVVKAAKEYNVLIELNESSVLGKSRPGSKARCQEVAKLCKEYDVPVIFGSDAHYMTAISSFDNTRKMIDEIDFPEELVMNYPERLIEFLHARGQALDVTVDSL